MSNRALPISPNEFNLNQNGGQEPTLNQISENKAKLVTKKSLPGFHQMVSSDRFELAMNLFLAPALSLNRFRSMPLDKPQITPSLTDPHYLSYRERIIEIIQELAALKEMAKTTIVLAVRLMDEICNKIDFLVNEFPLITVICLSLAAKLCEPLAKVPSLNELWTFLDGSFSHQKIISGQTIVFSLLQFNAFRITPLTAVSEYLIAGIISRQDLEKIWPSLRANFVYLLEDYCQHLAFMLIHNPCFNSFALRIVTSAVIFMARRHCLLKEWTPELTELTGVKEDELTECVAAFSGLTPFNGFIPPVNSISVFFRDDDDHNGQENVLNNALIDSNQDRIAVVRNGFYLMNIEQKDNDSTDELTQRTEPKAKTVSYLQVIHSGVTRNLKHETLPVIRPTNLQG